jgi:hypothetical protein
MFSLSSKYTLSKMPLTIRLFPLAALLLSTSLFFSSCDEEEDPSNMEPERLQVSFARVGGQSILDMNTVDGDGTLNMRFSHPVEVTSDDLFQVYADGVLLEDTESWNSLDERVMIELQEDWREIQTYTLQTSGPLTSPGVESLEPFSFSFNIAPQPLSIVRLVSDTVAFAMDGNALNHSIPIAGPFTFTFSHPLSISPAALGDQITLEGRAAVDFTVVAQSDSVFELRFPEPLADFTTYQLSVASSLGEVVGRGFNGLELAFYTGASAEPDFPILSDEALMTKVQEQTFRYFWDFGHPVSGMARERNTSLNTVTSGGSGFGLMSMIVAVERDFITLGEAINRWQEVVGFLENADRFHGAWAHWMNGETGEVLPFSALDNGGDLVETALLVQGLLTVREYLRQEAPGQARLINRITVLWEGVEWDWYTKGQDQVLYWHWSPEHEFEIDLRVTGHNETQITYILAAASPTHPIEPSVYHSGYARGGDMVNGDSFYNITLPLGNNDCGGPLFFSHYSYLGLDPRNLEDSYANYWTQNVNHSRINYQYCANNPRRYFGYSEQCWGLTASDSFNGYTAHSPTNDRGVITPTAALSSIVYTPEESLAALHHFYYHLGDRLWGEYGFYDAFHPGENWVADSYLAIDQGPIICMMENYRTGLLWELFMAAPEVQQGLDDLDFTY